MKLLKRVSVALLVLLLILQIPFAYRRYKLGRLSATIQQLNSQRIANTADTAYKQYSGVMHVHSFLGGHSPGTFEEIIRAAKANALAFVIMTEHPAREFNTAERTLSGTHEGVLFVNGNEVSTTEGDRLLVIPGDETTGSSSVQMSTWLVLQHAKAQGELTIAAYPDDFKNLATATFTGIEVYNVYTNTRHINPLVTFFDSLWSYRSYHDLLFATFYNRPSEALAKWDQTTLSRRVVAFAGNDAHSNIGLTLKDSSSKPLVGIKLDPYETSFRLVRVHALIPQAETLEQKTLIEALTMGHGFIAFDLFGDSSGFSFTATNGVDQRIQGDEIAQAPELHLTVSSPIPARVVLFKNGSAIEDVDGVTMKKFPVANAGVYRVELYLPQLGHRAGEQPWIISNPIYVR